MDLFGSFLQAKTAQACLELIARHGLDYREPARYKLTSFRVLGLCDGLATI
jgi:hypothetical protein